MALTKHNITKKPPKKEKRNKSTLKVQRKKERIDKGGETLQLQIWNNNTHPNCLRRQ